MCVRVCVCTCARSKLITISPYCNSNIRLVILSEKAWLVISLVVSFRFSRHLFSVINFLHFFSICKCRIWQNKYCIVLYISNKILEKIQLVPVVYDYHIRKELLRAQIHLQRLRTFFCFYLFLDSTGYCFTNWMIKQPTICPESGIGSLILSNFWLIRNFSLQLSISLYNVRWVVFY